MKIKNLVITILVCQGYSVSADQKTSFVRTGIVLPGRQRAVELNPAALSSSKKAMQMQPAYSLNLSSLSVPIEVGLPNEIPNIPMGVKLEVQAFSLNPTLMVAAAHSEEGWGDFGIAVGYRKDFSVNRFPIVLGFRRNENDEFSWAATMTEPFSLDRALTAGGAYVLFEETTGEANLVYDFFSTSLSIQLAARRNFFENWSVALGARAATNGLTRGTYFTEVARESETWAASLGYVTNLNSIQLGVAINL
jgi:hypothetical protein